MTSSPFVQKHTRYKELDLATRQAVEELRSALHRRHALEREDVQGKSVAYRSGHARKIHNAVKAHDAARLALDELLAEGS